MKVHIEDWRGSFEVEGYAVTCANDGPDLLGRETLFQGGIVQEFLKEWNGKSEELYGSTAQ